MFETVMYCAYCFAVWVVIQVVIDLLAKVFYFNFYEYLVLCVQEYTQLYFTLQTAMLLLLLLLLFFFFWISMRVLLYMLYASSTVHAYSHMVCRLLYLLAYVVARWGWKLVHNIKTTRYHRVINIFLALVLLFYIFLHEFL